MPALIFLGYSLNTEYWRIFFLALLGGWLGVLFMIPLRRQLIVKEHGNLTFPEGTACADVLVAGERGGSFAGRVFWGLGLGGVYTFCMNTLGMWPGQPEYQPAWLPGASFRAAVTSEYLGVGYIIGPARGRNAIRGRGDLVAGADAGDPVLWFARAQCRALPQHGSDPADDAPTSSGPATFGRWARARWRLRA